MGAIKIAHTFPFSFQLEIFTQCMPPDDMYLDEDYGGGFL